MSHSGSPRTSTAEWKRLRRAVLERDGYRCTATADGQRCTERATDAHHVEAHADGGRDEELNLVSLCAWHHRKITGRQGASARWRRPPKKQHPGMMDVPSARG